MKMMRFWQCVITAVILPILSWSSPIILEPLSKQERVVVDEYKVPYIAWPYGDGRISPVVHQNKIYLFYSDENVVYYRQGFKDSNSAKLNFGDRIKVPGIKSARGVSAVELHGTLYLFSASEQENNRIFYTYLKQDGSWAEKRYITDLKTQHYVTAQIAHTAYSKESFIYLTTGSSGISAVSCFQFGSPESALACEKKEIENAWDDPNAKYNVRSARILPYADIDNPYLMVWGGKVQDNGVLQLCAFFHIMEGQSCPMSYPLYEVKNYHSDRHFNFISAMHSDDSISTTESAYMIIHSSNKVMYYTFIRANDQTIMGVRNDEGSLLDKESQIIDESLNHSRLESDCPPEPLVYEGILYVFFKNYSHYNPYGRSEHPIGYVADYKVVPGA